MFNRNIKTIVCDCILENCSKLNIESYEKVHQRLSDHFPILKIFISRNCCLQKCQPKEIKSCEVDESGST